MKERDREGGTKKFLRFREAVIKEKGFGEGH